MSHNGYPPFLFFGPADAKEDHKACGYNAQHHDNGAHVGTAGVIQLPGDGGSKGCDQQVRVDDGIVQRKMRSSEEFADQSRVGRSDSAVSKASRSLHKPIDLIVSLNHPPVHINMRLLYHIQKMENLQKTL